MGGAGVADGADRRRGGCSESDGQDGQEVGPGDAELFGGGVEHAGQDFDEHVGQSPGAKGPGGESGQGHQAGFGPDEAAELAGGCAQCCGDGERATPFGQAQPQGEAWGGGGQGEGEPQLDLGQAAEVDGGEAGADDLAATGDVGHGGLGPELSAELIGDGCDVRASGVDKERPDRVAAGRLGDVVGVGEQEAVAWGGRELLHHPDVVELNVGVLLGPPVLESKGDGIPG